MAIRVSPRLLRMMGKKLYSTRPAIIITRELLQNSRDACVRRQPESDQSNEVVIELSSTGLIACMDSGVGMDADVMFNKLLNIGETTKAEDSNAIGAFGIGAAAIFSSDRWSIWSHDIYHDSDMATWDKPNPPEEPGMYFVKDDSGSPVLIRRKTYLDGTTIKCWIETGITEDTLNRIDVMTLMAEMQGVNLIYSMDGEQRTRQSCGLPQESDLLLHKRVEIDDGRSGYAEIKFSPDIKYKNGLTIFRLNGLPMFVETAHHSDAFIVVDIHSDLRAEATKYPLNMSREELQWNWRWPIQTEYDTIRRNFKTVVSEVEKNKSKSEPRFLIDGDATMNGLRPDGVGATFLKDSLVPLLENLGIMYEWLKGKEWESDPNGDLHKLKMLKFKSTPLTNENRAIAVVWSSICQMVCNNDRSFGIGLYSNTDNIEPSDYETVWEANECFQAWTLNAEWCRQFPAPHALVFAMWHEACHIAAHIDTESNYHDENWSDSLRGLSAITATILSGSIVHHCTVLMSQITFELTSDTLGVAS